MPHPTPSRRARPARHENFHPEWIILPALVAMLVASMLALIANHEGAKGHKAVYAPPSVSAGVPGVAPARTPLRHGSR